MRAANRIAYDIIVTIIGLVFVASRLHVRYCINRGSLRSTVPAYILSDVFMVASLIFAATAAGIDVSTQIFKLREIGEHKFYGSEPTKNLIWMVVNQKLYLQWIEMNFKHAYIILIVCWIALYFAKGSFLLFYWTTVRSLNRRVYRLLIFVTIITAMSFIATLGLLLFNCLPISDQWTISTHNCMARNTFSTYKIASIGAALHLSTHMALLLIGFLIVRSHVTALGRWEWFSVAMLFGLGVMIFTAHCIRYAVQMSISTADTLKNIFYDYGGSRLEIWMLASALAELHICLIAISLPTLKLWLHRRKQQQSRLMTESPGKSERKSAFHRSRERNIMGIPRPPPAALSFHLSALTTRRSERNTLQRLSTTESAHNNKEFGRPTDSEQQMTNASNRSGRERIIKVYGATTNGYDEFERKGSIRIMNAENY
ncbi:hypothetical protein EX30DRAFT_364186 [Ascodesmis nigricans]|uniref:Rhodopsin domain-containing protein n=1 Tax=Ascodesmis nigricans TaxID=341454 RepID=A0A4V3SIP2_9PEZI|nr:hypothetical protein EX30DRAFT_364186 [Ascodesmis nigricans]